MAIAVRGSAWSPFTTLVRQFDADFDNLLRTRTTTFRPAADVTKDGNDVVVTLSLPGVDVDKDVDIEVTDGKLAISGRRSDKTETEQDGVLVREIRSGEFHREFSLPKGVTADRIEADYDKGLLKVRVREVIAQPTQPAKIKVRSQSAAQLTETPATETAAE